MTYLTTRPFVALLLVASFLFGTYVRAESQLLTFEEVIESAFKGSPVVRNIEAKILGDASNALGVVTLPNAELSFEGRPYVNRQSEGKEVEYEVSLSQPLRISNFGARQRVAALIKRSGDYEHLYKLYEFSQSVLLAYGKAWVLQEKEGFLQTSVIQARRLSKKLAGGVQGGLVAESTQKLFLAEDKKLTAMLKAVEGDKNRAFAELMRQAGVIVLNRRLAPIVIPSKPRDPVSPLDTSFPLSERIRLRAELGRAQRDLAHLDVFPRFAPKIGFEHTDDGDDRINIGFTMELPFSDRNQAARARTAAEYEANVAEYAYTKDGRLDEEIKLLMVSANAAQQQAEVFRIDVVPAIHAALSAAERELSAGQGSPFQVWQILLELTSSQDRYLELWMKALSERAELSILLGQDYMGPL